jgi:hypothetical protein
MVFVTGPSTEERVFGNPPLQRVTPDDGTFILISREREEREG